MRRPSRKIEEEIMQLNNKYFSQFSEEEMQEDFDEADYEAFFRERESVELMLWREYCSHIGDEGQLLEKNGTPILSNDGSWIQDFQADSSGMAVMLDGSSIFYSDGMPVPFPRMPDIIEQLYSEEEKDLMLQTILDKLCVNSMDEFWENEKRIVEEFLRKGLTVERRNPLLKLTDEEMDFLEDNGYVK